MVRPRKRQCKAKSKAQRRVRGAKKRVVSWGRRQVDGRVQHKRTGEVWKKEKKKGARARASGKGARFALAAQDGKKGR